MKYTVYWPIGRIRDRSHAISKFWIEACQKCADKFSDFNPEDANRLDTAAGKAKRNLAVAREGLRKARILDDQLNIVRDTPNIEWAIDSSDLDDFYPELSPELEHLLK